jgi:hypothetical protein
MKRIEIRISTRNRTSTRIKITVRRRMVIPGRMYSVLSAMAESGRTKPIDELGRRGLRLGLGLV